MRDHKNVSMPVKLVAGSLYLTAVAQLDILKTFQHISHLFQWNFFCRVQFCPCSSYLILTLNWYVCIIFFL